jgi:hypothetical protein
MHTNKTICEKIRSIYPDIGDCGEHLNVNYDQVKGVWAIDLKNGNRHLKTYLEPHDIDTCVEGNQCFGIGLQVNQLKDNLDRL